MLYVIVWYAIDMAYTVYALYDAREPGAVRYIGFSSDPQKRLGEHLTEVRKISKVTRKLTWLRQILSEGITPSWRVLDNAETITAAAGIERIRIKEYRELGHSLTNGTHGGDGSTAWAKQETRDQQKKVMLDHWASPEGELHRQQNVEANKRIQTGRKRSDESREKMRLAKLGKPQMPRTEEWKAKIAAAQAGKKRRPWTDEERARHMAGMNREKMSASAKARKH